MFKIDDTVWFKKYGPTSEYDIYGLPYLGKAKVTYATMDGRAPFIYQIREDEASLHKFNFNDGGIHTVDEDILFTFKEEAMMSIENELEMILGSKISYMRDKFKKHAEDQEREIV